MAGRRCGPGRVRGRLTTIRRLLTDIATYGPIGSQQELKFIATALL